jgi:hypothetical protein
MFFTAALLAAIALPINCLATMVDASLIPDGTYGVTVEKILDAAHVTVGMVGGLESTLSAGPGVHFDKVKAGDRIKITVLKGKVLAFNP